VEGLLFIMLLAVVALLMLAFWFWMLVDCILRKMDSTQKVLWFAMMFILGPFPPIADLIYLFVVKVRSGEAKRIVE